MNYYILENGKIVFFDVDKARLLSTTRFVPQYADLEILETERNIISFNGGFYFEDEIKAELAQAEAERIAKFYLTGADVERGIYQAKGMDFDDIMAYVTANPPEGLDVKALKIELKANHFYRGNPYVDAIGGLLGFTKEQLDKFFESGDYEHLLTIEESASLPTSPTGGETLEDVAPLQTSLADEILSDESEEFEKEID